MAVTRARVLAARLGRRSIVAAARLVHLRRARLRFTRRCSSLRVQNLIAMRMMMLPALLLVLQLIIQSHFALLLQV